ncbi:MAG: copper resistance protein CopC [Pseudomonadota bacterium]|nr:copper resistance protein CopC [Pseudomonadota bacterium]
MTHLFTRHRGTARGWMVCAALALLQPAAWPPARAHAVITEDSLARQPVQPGKPMQVQLQFNTGVEIKLSRVTLVSQGDIEQVVPMRAGARPGQVLVSLPALSSGDYALRCQVFAADGHLTQEIRRFRVGSGEQMK